MPYDYITANRVSDVISLSDSKKEKIRRGLLKYKEIMTHFQYLDEEFYHNFKSFYRTNLNKKFNRNEWSCFSAFIEYYRQFRGNDYFDFANGLNNRFVEICGCNEWSYASKFTHTVFNNFPIIDGNVKSFFNIGYYKFKHHPLECLREINEFYNEYSRSRVGRENINNFLTVFEDAIGDYQISDTKIIDFIIWGSK